MAAVLVAAGSAAVAQPAREDSSQGAFSLASGQVYGTGERPSFLLTFRRVTSLDFRVYRVNDPLQFFAKLRDPHVLGSEEPIVPQERTILERIATWKADMRDDLRAFVRAQFSREYRRQRREQSDTRQVTLRRTVRYSGFAQVPLLNPSQLVASWREMLPPVREAEVRRIPLEVHDPGVYVVEAVNPPLRAYTIVIVSDIGLVTKAAPGQIFMFAANRLTGEPLPGCDLLTVAERQVIASGKTASDGTFDLSLTAARQEDIVSVARCGNQIAATDPGSWYLREASRTLVGYVYTDKPIYRPGHTVHLRAVLRWRTRGALAPVDAKQVEVSISDSNDKVVYRQPRPVDEFGSVQAAFSVPSGAALGYYSVTVSSDDQQASGTFEVQEYRKPEFEVTVAPAERFVLQGGRASATISARYYFGQPVPGATVKWVVHRQPYYSPLRWSEDEEPEEYGGWYGGGQETLQGTTQLNDLGTATVSIPLPADDDGRDYSAQIEARVTDSSEREVAGRAVVNATFGRFLIVGRTDRYLYSPGTAATLSLRAIDYQGAAQPGLKVDVWLEKLKPGATWYGNPSVETISQSQVQTDPEGRASWTVPLSAGAGDYRFRATARSGERLVTDESLLWVPGSSDLGTDTEQYLELIADKKVYQPGDTARFMIRGAGFDAPALITKESQTVSYHRVERIRANQAIEVPISEDDLGDTYVNLAFLKDDRFYRAEKRVRVPATSRQLQITIVPDQAVSRPRQPGTATVTVTDASGTPVRAELSVGVIDEAVYGVKPDDTPDPLRFFYRREYSRVGTQFSREYSFIGYSGTEQLLLTGRRRPMALADFKREKPLQPEVRKDFPDAIYWTADLVTGDDGRARFELTYPDALTTWRMTVRAVTADTLVGGAVARTTTTKDLIARVVTPRFLTEGDQATIPVIVHNYLPGTQTVTASIQSTGLSPAAAAGPGKELPAARTADMLQGTEQRFDWAFTADTVGTATVTGTAVTATATDSVELPIPVLPFGLKREVGAAGSIRGTAEASATLAVPERSNPAARVIRVSLAPSLAGTLLGALDFLTSYPYGCTEQTLSSFLPNLVVLRALNELKIAPTERLGALDRQVSEGLARLYDYQHDDGGWGWWKTDQNHPFMTAYAVYGLLEAQAAGYRVAEDRTSRGVRALTRLYAKYPRAVPDLKAYIVYVLALASERDVLPEGGPDEEPYDQKAAVEQLWAGRDRMSPYGRALLLLALQAAGDSRAADLASELLAGVRTKGDLAWWPVENDPLLEDAGDTSVEATALALKGLARQDPRNPVLERAVRWLLLNRANGTYWSSTKQTAMVLYGLLDYMRARDETESVFPVEVFVNGAPVGMHNFTQAELASPDPVVFSVPAREGDNLVRIVKRGTGAVYWSANARYFDTRGPIEPTGSHKLAVVRRYYSLAPVQKGGRIVYRETPFGGTAKPGDVLLVRLSIAGSTDWRYLVVEDPLPAATEPIRQDSLYELEQRGGIWYGSRREFRDDRVVFFQQEFTEGRYEYRYLLRVVTPGSFRAMPAQVAPMYVPGVSASSNPQAVSVTAAPPR